MNTDAGAPRRDAVIRGVTARASAAGHPGAVTVSTPFWLYWLDVAIEQLELAVSARRQGVHQREAGGDFGAAMIAETRAGMMAAVAGAACVESFSKTIASLTGHDLSSGGPAAKVAFEVLRRSFSIKEAGLDEQLRTLFDDRNKAIHSAEEDRPTEPHPLGVSSGSVNAFYTVERATEAVRLVSGLLAECLSCVRPDEEFAPLARRLERHRETVREQATRAGRAGIGP